MSKLARRTRAANDVGIKGIVPRYDDPNDPDHVRYYFHRDRKSRRAEFHLNEQSKFIDEETGDVVKYRWRDLSGGEKLGL